MINFCARCPWPGRIFEGERLCIGDGADKLHGRIEIGIGFAGKTDNEVAGHGDIGAARARM
ncbi:hypothetical protein EH240_14260 [Mesorhizobium tamadayense]|uniref:Uncharacterized protein n=1 Tax=Mesorhizobium tamadayense TaxID=425306 RepID=A0A3P3FT96_9HYPH|nr:hypothetical protein EH240_14260 [Mesorhizobium tamadayense]